MRTFELQGCQLKCFAHPHLFPDSPSFRKCLLQIDVRQFDRVVQAQTMALTIQLVAIESTPDSVFQADMLGQRVLKLCFDF